jgi:hypothetical protein
LALKANFAGEPWTADTIEPMATKILLTWEQFEQLPDDGTRHELDEGELISKSPALGFLFALANSSPNPNFSPAIGKRPSFMA